MGAPEKIGQFIKNSFSGIFQKENELEAQDKSSDWSNKDETVLVKKCELEALKTELFDQTQIIKKLQDRNAVNSTIISDYENSFVSIGVRDRDFISLTKEKLLEEIEKLKSSENRLKSHIKALKRDLILAEENKDACEDVHNNKVVCMDSRMEELANSLKRKNSQIQDLMLTNEELRISLEKRCEEVVELCQVCKGLLEDFI